MYYHNKAHLCVRTLKSKKSSGSDEISNFMIKRLTPSYVGCLSKCLNDWIERNIFLNDTKTAKIVILNKMKVFLCGNNHFWITARVGTSKIPYLSAMNWLVVTLWYLKHYHSECFIAREFNLVQRTVAYSLSSVLNILHSCAYREFISLPDDMSNRTTSHRPEEHS